MEMRRAAWRRIRETPRGRAAGRIDAGAGLVDDHVGHALVLQFLFDQFGEEILGVAAGRAVADDRHRELVPLDQFETFCRASPRRSGLPTK